MAAFCFASYLTPLHSPEQRPKERYVIIYYPCLLCFFVPTPKISLTGTLLFFCFYSVLHRRARAIS